MRNIRHVVEELGLKRDIRSIPGTNLNYWWASLEDLWLDEDDQVGLLLADGIRHLALLADGVEDTLTATDPLPMEDALEDLEADIATLKSGYQRYLDGEATGSWNGSEQVFWFVANWILGLGGLTEITEENRSEVEQLLQAALRRPELYFPAITMIVATLWSNPDLPGFQGLWRIVDAFMALYRSDRQLAERFIWRWGDADDQRTEELRLAGKLGSLLV